MARDKSQSEAASPPVYHMPMQVPIQQPLLPNQAPQYAPYFSPPDYHQPTVIVEQKKPGEDDLVPALLIFLFGFFGICCVWAAGFAYLKSENPTARALAMMSAVMFVVSCIMTVLVIFFYLVIIIASFA